MRLRALVSLVLVLLLVSCIPDLAGGGGAELVPCGPSQTSSPTATKTSTPAATIAVVTPVPRTPTPIAKHPLAFLEARFTPKARMNVRNAASLQGVIVGYLTAGQTVSVYEEVFPTPDSAWLCLDLVHFTDGTPAGSDCQRVVAYRIGSITYGIFEILQP